MNKELALKIAVQNKPDASLPELMESTNEVLKSYGSQTAFSALDIVNAKFMNYIKMTGTEREFDLITVYELLPRAWDSLHVKVQVLKEPLSSSDKKDIEAIVPALTRLGQLHLLTEGLTKKTKKDWLFGIPE